MGKTKIEWCDLTINPIVGCSHCSPGCDNCYAERFAARLAKNPQTAAKYAGVVDEYGRWTGRISEPDYSIFGRLPKKPKCIFVGSMTDIFHRGTTFDDLRILWAEMTRLQQHTFVILTKRADRMYAFLEDNAPNPAPNIWLNVTICNQQEANEKIQILLQTPAAKRGVCVEPMLGPVDLEAVSFTHSPGFFGGALRWHHLPHCRRAELVDGAVYPHLDWVIAGGETGPNARPMHPDWARSLRDQCQEAGVPFFFKGNGEWLFDICPDHPEIFLERRVGKKFAGRLLDGREWNEVPS
jgi:protein gp37